MQANSREETAVHGSNLWPEQLPEFEGLLRKYIADCLNLGSLLMQGKFSLLVFTLDLNLVINEQLLCCCFPCWKSI